MFRIIAALAAFSISLAAHASCGSAFCMVNTNWSQGAWTEAGTRLDLRYEYINQDQPRSGTGKVGVGEIPHDHDEVRTVNRNWVAALDHAFNANWGVNVTLPVVDRFHQHIHNDSDTGDKELETWDFSSLGDMRVLGRYQFAAHDHDNARIDVWGLNFGLKLPTGHFHEQNVEGEPAERTLQPGTGTTDALLGAYYSSSLGLQNLSWFTQALYQSALNTREDFKPGNRVGVDLGARYLAADRVGLMLQLNYLQKGRDKGLQAEPEDSGGSFVYLSPGVSWDLNKDLQLYGFVQLPLYQKVNGVQLTADYSMVVGVSTRF
ncbi:MAG TPA: hypothetical protein VGI18_12060 [Burkholderiales bacterium]|jgi:hypothetical protein